MKLFPLFLAPALLLLPSCESIPSEEYTPEYLKESSPLDPPGTEAARQALRQQRVKEGKYEEGSTQTVQQGRAFLFFRNPEYDAEAGGRLVEAEEATIRSCEGLYYFVEMSDGKRGYLRESDFEDPMAMETAAFMSEGLEGMEPIQLDENQTLTTNADGRTVLLVGKKSDRSAQFEKLRKAVETGAPVPVETPAEELPAPSSELPPLPEPAGDGPQE